MDQLGLKEAEGAESKLPTFSESKRKPGDSRKASASASIDYCKAFDYVNHNKLWKILKAMRIPYLPAEKPVCRLRSNSQMDMEQHTGSILGKEYIKVVYCHPARLTNMQSTSCEMLGWMKFKVESRLLGEISIISDIQMIPP